jgi:DNA gyrase/topoisomerase IV subunit A
LVTSSQIEDWIHEIEERPASAALILRSIAARLSELDQWNEELLADNIALRSGERVEEYVSRIAALEYQLELLKRSGVVPAQAGEGSSAAQPSAGCLILFNAGGQILRLPVPADLPTAGMLLGRFAAPLDPDQPPGFLAAANNEELLFVFDSGRTVTLPAGQIAASPAELDWREAHRILPRPGEELVAALPINSLALAEYCVQVSRRGCAKLMPKSPFQSLIARGSIGAGIKRRPDKTALLVLCGREDGLALATREGNLVTLPVSRVPYSVDEVLQLSVSDYIIAGFPFTGKSDLLFVTNTGKTIRRAASWLEPAGSFKTRGQAVFSSSRRDVGVRLAGAVPVQERGQCAVLRSDGAVWGYPMAVLASSAAIETGPQPGELLAFTLCAGSR